jgi:peptide/nickel transport system substrate-binding protein
MLSTFTTTQILNWGDSNYSNPEYDQLYKDQLAAVDPADPADPTERAEVVHEMQKILYRDSPYIIMWYSIALQAYNTAKWQGYSLVPPEDGAPFFNLTRTTYQDLQPKVADTATTESGAGGSSWIWIVAGIAAVTVIAVIVWLVKRPRRVEEA